MFIHLVVFNLNFKNVLEQNLLVFYENQKQRWIMMFVFFNTYILLDLSQIRRGFHA